MIIAIKTPNPIPALKIPPMVAQLESRVVNRSNNDGKNSLFFMRISL